MTDNEIIKALECCSTGETYADCEKNGCPLYLGITMGCKYIDKENQLYSDALDLINRQQAEIERLNEHYKNLAKASIRHAFDTENDRQLLHEYQNIFLGLGYGLKEVQDPELKEIKSWKDRAIWHVKRCDQLNKELKTAKFEAIKEFAEELKERLELCDTVVESGNFGITIKVGYETVDVLNAIYNLVKEKVGETE